MPISNPAIPSQQDWQAPTLLNSWTNYGGAYPPVGYWKDSFGVVYVRGAVKNGSLNVPVFTLPEGYRPGYWVIVPVVSLSSANAQVTARVQIGSGGNVTISTGDTNLVCLDGIAFRPV